VLLASHLHNTFTERVDGPGPGLQPPSPGRGSAPAYNPEDLPVAYSNATIHSRLNEYTSMTWEVHGSDYDPSTQPLDGEIIMRVGGGKKYGQYWIGDSILDTASTPTLSQIQARSTSSSPTICPRLDSAQTQMEVLQVISVLSVIY